MSERRHHLDVRVVTPSDDLISLMGKIISEAEVQGRNITWHELDPATEPPFIVRFEGELEALWAVLRVMLVRYTRFTILDVDCDYGSEGEEPS